MRRLLIPAVLGLALVACQDQAPNSSRSIVPAKQFVFSQANHFFLLPPLAPAEPVTTGTFQGDLSPIIEICTLTGANGNCTGPLIGTFSRTSGTNNQLIFVVPGQRYELDWDTEGLGIPNGTYARITVRSSPGGGTVFGVADIYIDSSENLGNAVGGAVGVRKGTVLPIKFIMEDGILCQNDAECFEGTIDSNGGTFTFPDGTAGVQAPAGAINQGESGNLVIERYHGPDPCLPTDFPQYEDCLRVHIEGNITTLNTNVEVGFCLDASAPNVSELEMQKWDEVDPNTLRTLQSADVSDFITCSQFGSAQMPRGELAKLAYAAGRLIKPILGIKEAYAANTMGPGPIPFGAGMSDFSRLGVVRPLNLDKVSGDNSSAPAGSSVTPTVKVTSKKTGAPVAGVHIQFTPTAGAGSATPLDAFTDLSGLAATSWTLGVGGNSLRADAFNPKPGFPSRPVSVFASATFNGTGTVTPPLVAIFLPPIGKNNANPVKQVHNQTASISICLLNASNVCTSTTYGPFSAIDDGTKYQTAWNTPKNLIIGGIYRITVTVNGTALTASAIDIQPIAGGKAKNLTNGTTFSFQLGSNQPLKFSVEAQ